MSDKKKFPILNMDDVRETIIVSKLNSITHNLQIPEKFRESIRSYFIRDTSLYHMDVFNRIPFPVTRLFGYTIVWQGDSVDVIPIKKTIPLPFDD